MAKKKMPKLPAYKVKTVFMPKARLRNRKTLSFKVPSMPRIAKYKGGRIKI